MHASWNGIFNAEKILQFIATEDNVVPPREQIFRALSLPLEQVKVLIIGQDPYPTPGHAIGIAFGTAPGVRPLPKSLKNIFMELSQDLAIPEPIDGDLTAWIDQGVLLLNRVLTTTAGVTAAHKNKGWEEITDAIVDAVARRNAPLVAILWGKEAQKFAPIIGNDRCICSPHPSPLSAYRGFFGSRPFSRANKMLKEQGSSPVNWELPSA
ncbi:uracil-DNA glycosylase [Corynebacterium kutscheri]|uniref:Uracil-DNA glycosylase n=1 Tax=Corynebacterium kutscheri TaxID=35755 RepID=A0A0F6QZC6_9CORY|nr:uracil-DNA glycosylase [Corynebacterium kutscheri]AKE41072.1 Uracil-DNA glycosylase [Corynebacterium kutscheri]VEH06962.1 uracil-DNA glycosylase [Corynebacterium kutscheri]VEH09376.1 uracil-DNA glycosylase [Corynebacterium kutscheri]VEH79457.1 uracil-DNA glycosylase [Corynebacterium kutscheri]